MIFIKKLNSEDIQKLAQQQKSRLNEYYRTKLLPLNLENSGLSIILEDPNYDNSKQLLDIITEVTTKPETVIEKPSVEPLDLSNPEDIIKYTNIRLPFSEFKHKRLTSRQLIVGNKYLLPNDEIATLIEKPTKTEPQKKIKFDNDISYNLSELNIRETIPSSIVSEKTYKILKEDYLFIKD